MKITLQTEKKFNCSPENTRLERRDNYMTNNKASYKLCSLHELIFLRSDAYYGSTMAASSRQVEARILMKSLKLSTMILGKSYFINSTNSENRILSVIQQFEPKDRISLPTDVFCQLQALTSVPCLQVN